MFYGAANYKKYFAFLELLLMHIYGHITCTPGLSGAIILRRRRGVAYTFITDAYVCEIMGR